MRRPEKFSFARRQQQQQQSEDRSSRRSLPRQIILIRHAESLGNVAPEAYAHTPDSEIPLVRHWHAKGCIWDLAISQSWIA